MVCSRSGHRSDAVNVYKRPLKSIKQSVSNALNVPMMNDSYNKANLEVHNVVKSDLNLPEGKSKNDTMVISIPDGINNVVIDKNGKNISISL